MYGCITKFCFVLQIVVIITVRSVRAVMAVMVCLIVFNCIQCSGHRAKLSLVISSTCNYVDAGMRSCFYSY